MNTAPTTRGPTEAELWTAVAAVNDPEMPPLTIEDLGILRAVAIGVDADGSPTAVITVTPTYSGCPAVEYIEEQIVEAVISTGFARDDVIVERSLAPAWSTDWITDTGRAKLSEAGISPPRPTVPGETPVRLGSIQLGPIRCPQCGSANTEEVSHFGSTACKALHRCLDCAEPFDHVKEF